MTARSRGSSLRLSLALTAVFAGAAAEAASAQQPVQVAQPDASSCQDGVITSIDLDRTTVFDPESTGIGAIAWTYRLMNVLHVTTRPTFIRRELLFDVGDCYDEFLVQESERLLDSYGFLANARITSAPDASGGRHLTVRTEDKWSTKVDVGVTYDEGPNLEKLEVTEENFLGQGVFAEFTHQERLEVRVQSMSLSTPRLFGRTDASIELGRDRPGTFFNQYVRYPFIGETGRYSVRQGYSRATSFYAFVPPADNVATQVVVPQFREVIEFSAAQRFGARGRSVIAGFTLSRDVTRFGAVEAAIENNLGELAPYPGEVPMLLTDQLQESASTRAWLHFGARQIRFQEYRGIDGLRDRLLVGIGAYAGVSVGRGFGILTPEGITGRDELFGRASATFTSAVGSSILHGGSYVEARRESDSGRWQDVLADAELVGFLRNDGLPGQTFFLRASFAGGWSTSVPYQLSLGGREGVRSLPEDTYPGGRMARFVFEDRVVFPWPQRTMDLGMTAFADVGRVWTGDAPFAVGSGWKTAVGAGVRFGFPSRTRHIIRADVAFPVGGAESSPIFRMTFEFNRMVRGFFTPDMVRSRRFDLGADHF